MDTDFIGLKNPPIITSYNWSKLSIKRCQNYMIYMFVSINKNVCRVIRPIEIKPLESFRLVTEFMKLVFFCFLFIFSFSQVIELNSRNFDQVLKSDLFMVAFVAP